MKLHADKPDANTITAYGDGWIAVNGERLDQSVVLASSGERIDWGCKAHHELNAGHFTSLLELTGTSPELVIFGSGKRLRFVRPALLESLINRGVGVETMDTQAACRTFNILAGEGRRVVAALLIENGDAGLGQH
ncbi:MAG TPA: Mth938-like domain-containing protein [Hydrogenophaga sp.]|nr:Mth938-like domain-containing protein [Hydrogenophaga sp.]